MKALIGGAGLGYAYGIKKPILALLDQDHITPLICEGMITDVLRVEDMNKIDDYLDLLIEKIKKITK